MLAILGGTGPEGKGLAHTDGVTAFFLEVQFLLALLLTYSLIPGMTEQADRHKSYSSGLEYPY